MITWKRFRSPILAGAMGLAFAGSLSLVHAGGTETKPSSYAPDNTGKNLRDVQGGPLTPEDQSGSKSDVLLTQKIRNAVTEDSNLSITAKNIKIITVSGVVTWRGPLNSSQEKEAIASKATQIAGASNVNNQLEVIPAKDSSSK